MTRPMERGFTRVRGIRSWSRRGDVEVSRVTGWMWVGGWDEGGNCPLQQSRLTRHFQVPTQCLSAWNLNCRASLLWVAPLKGLGILPPTIHFHGSTTIDAWSPIWRPFFAFFAWTRLVFRPRFSWKITGRFISRRRIYFTLLHFSNQSMGWSWNTCAKSWSMQSMNDFFQHNL